MAFGAPDHAVFCCFGAVGVVDFGAYDFGVVEFWGLCDGLAFEVFVDVLAGLADGGVWDFGYFDFVSFGCGVDAVGCFVYGDALFAWERVRGASGLIVLGHIR